MRSGTTDVRIDLTLLEPGGHARDLAVLAPAGTRWDAVSAHLPAGCERPWYRDRPLDPAAPFGHAGPRPGAVLRAAAPRAPDDAPVGTGVGTGAGTGAGTGVGTGVGTDAGGGHRLEVVGGPDAGRSIPLGRAAVLVGRARECALVLRDPTVSRVHALIGLSADGGYVRDRGSATGTTVESVPVGRDPVAAPPGRYVRLGDSVLRLAASPARPALTTPGPHGTALVHRPPGRSRAAERLAAEIALPEAPHRAAPARVPWLAATAPAVLGGVLALLVHSPTFLLFAVLSPLTLLGSALGERIHRRRRERGSRRRYRAELAAAREAVTAALGAEADRLRAAAPDPVTVARTAQLPGTALWERTAAAPDRLAVRLGLADLPARTQLRDGTRTHPAGTLSAVPAVVDLAGGPLGISGPAPAARAVARWVLAQLSVQVDPAELRIVLLLSPDAEPHWRWARWLPHLDGPPALARGPAGALVTELAALRELRAGGAAPDTGAWPGPWTVLVVDDCRAVADLPGLPELLRDGHRFGLTAVTVSTQAAAQPADCATLAAVTGDTGSRLTVTAGPAEPVTVLADQVSPAWCETLARALAPLRVSTPSTRLPTSCALPDLLGPDPVTPAAVGTRWQASDGSLSTPLGAAADGPVLLDLVRDGPHALVAGTTGSGKSELLRTLVAGLALTYPPDEVGFVLVDYKGGAAFAECARLPHTLGVVTDLDAPLAARALASLECELRRREHLFADAGVRDYSSYSASYRAARCGSRGAPGHEVAPVPRLVIVVDEFAELAAELGEFVTGLVGIARRGRSLGVHLVLATQRPAGVVSPEIRANTAVRIALRVADAGDSRDVIEAPDAARIDRRRPGRAYLRVGGAPPLLVQTALAGLSGASAEEAGPRVRVWELDAWRRPREPGRSERTTGPGLGALVDVVVAAAAEAGRPAPPGPWRPPLPRRLPLADLPADPSTAAEQVAVGLVDLPRRQQQLPFTVDLGGGSLLFAGGAGSGRTSALLTLAVAAAGERGPDRLHIHAIDHAGGGLAELSELPHAGSLLGDDPAATARLLARLADEVARRRARDPAERAAEPAMLLLLDGWEQFLAAAERHDAHEPVDALLDLLRTGPSAGLTVALAGDRGTFAPRLAAAVRTKLVLPLTDEADYALAGIATRAVPGDPTAGRAVRAEDGAQVQLAHPGAAPTLAELRHEIGSIARRRRRGRGDPEPIRVRALPSVVPLRSLPPASAADRLRAGAAVTLGVGGDAAEPLVADLRAGRARLLVAGPPGSGRSTLLLGLLAQLTGQGRRVTVAAPEHSPLAATGRANGVPVLTPEDRPSETDRPPTAPQPDAPDVLLIDDCELFRDRPAERVLLDWADAAHRPAVVAAGGGDELAVAFRGIAAHVRRARCGLLLHPGPGDGDLLGLPRLRRRTGGPPGRGVLLGDPAWGSAFAAGPLPIQVALP